MIFPVYNFEFWCMWSDNPTYVQLYTYLSEIYTQVLKTATGTLYNVIDLLKNKELLNLVSTVCYRQFLYMHQTSACYLHYILNMAKNYSKAVISLFVDFFKNAFWVLSSHNIRHLSLFK